MIKSNLNYKIESNIDDCLAELSGKGCCRQQVGWRRSLSLGFGNKVVHNNKKFKDNFYGEWEIGTYTAAWRVIKNGEVLCGSQDVCDSVDELDHELNRVNFGKICAIIMLSNFDIRVEFENDICVEFLGVSSDKDEMFHVFCPKSFFVEYSISSGWKIGKSNEPWS